MKIIVNGKEHIFNAKSLALSEVLKSENVEKPEMVSIQLNGEFVKREEFPVKQLKEGDAVDFLYFMGGGRF